MARVVYTQDAFNAGEMSPKIGRRVSVEQYTRGSATLTNFLPTPQGPAERRMGKRYVTETKTSANESRLIPFIFSEIDSYVMEFGDSYIRFIRNFEVVTNGDVGAGGTASDPYEISTSYTTSDLVNIKYAQDGDIMYLVAGGTSIRPQKLSRQSTGQFTIEDLANTNGPVLDVIEQTATLTASAVSGTGITITASAATFQSAHVGSLWELRDNSNTLSTRGYFRITAFTSSTSVTADVVGDDLFGTTASSYWGEAAWSGVRGYPRAIAFHESRLALAGTDENPLTVYFSKTNANYEDFDYADANDSDAMTVTLSGQKNTIQWVASDTNFLVAGTYGGLAFVGSGSSTQALTPSTIQARNGESYGSKNVQGLLFGTGIKYIQGGGQIMYQAEYDDISLKYKTVNFTQINDEILNNVKYMDFQTEPFETLWMVDGDGKIVGFTQENEQGVNAFNRYTTDGNYESIAVVPNQGQDQVYVIVNRTINSATKRYIEYIEPDKDLNFYVDSGVEYNGKESTISLTLSAVTGTGITVTASASKFVSGDVGRKILTFDSSGNPVGRATITGYTSGTVVTADVTADFASTSVSEWYLTATTISGLSHLEGKEVQVSSDGAFVGTKTVSSGSITIDDEDAGGLIYVGLQYTSDLKPFGVDAGSSNGSSVTKPKRAHRIGFSVYQTAGFKYGRDFSNLLTLPSRKATQPMNASVPLFGSTEIEDIVRSHNARWDRNPSVAIRQDFPAPLTVAAITYYMVTHDT
jgi:hypothetical protein